MDVIDRETVTVQCGGGVLTFVPVLAEGTYETIDNGDGTYTLRPKVEKEPGPEQTYERWRPKECRAYWYINDCGGVERDAWHGHPHDIARWEVGNCYPNEAIAQRTSARIRATLRLWDLAERMNKDRIGRAVLYYIMRDTQGKIIAGGSHVDCSSPAGRTDFLDQFDRDTAIEILTAEGLINDLFLEP